MTPSPFQSSIHELIQSYYTKRVQEKSSCCITSSCCSGADSLPSRFEILPLGEQPISFGCGDPLTIADLQPGQIVLDLGSGTGYDCFLAGKQVGEHGKVIGVDMTPQMVRQANQTARRLGTSNVEFCLGYLENLPIQSNSVDVILSNCVINLAPDKYRVLSEAFRVLKPGGRFAVTDMVSLRPLPATIRQDAEAWAACIAGAITTDEWMQILSAVGFKKIEIALSESLANPLGTELSMKTINAKGAIEPVHSVVSARIIASKGLC